MKSKCFSFYSYKGGSGRSTTLVNTTKHLADILNASKTQPILLIDADLESAGLTYFFHCETKFTARFNSTLHAELFLNSPKEVLEGIKGNNTFGTSRDWVANEAKMNSLCERLETLMSDLDIRALLAEVQIRETTWQILDSIVAAAERLARSGTTAAMEDDSYLCKTYNLRNLCSRLYDAPDAVAKRRVIEDFLPTDGMVDVSAYFGKEEGSVKFIGADVAFVGEHAILNNTLAKRNKDIIAMRCGEKGFSAILFDCGAGVQSTAHVLNYVSDVIVYCMRPTHQFASGTLNQLENYRECLEKTAQVKNAISRENGGPTDKKSVILLPTAVPAATEETVSLQKDSFDRIEGIALRFREYVDGTFCQYECSLREVAVFKWRELVLGVKAGDAGKLSASSAAVLERYSAYEKMPIDAKSAYDTYKHLAQRLVYNA